MAATGLSSEIHWILVGHEGAAKSTGKIALTELPCHAGRRAEMTLKLPYPSVSGKHAELYEENGELWVNDLNSTNGTYVNGKAISEPHSLGVNDLVQFAEAVFRVGRESPAETRATSFAENVCDEALALAQFDRLLTERAVTPYFQPIVSADGYQLVAYEVLGRSRLYGLNTPVQMFNAAATLNMEAELSRLLRTESLKACEATKARPHLFLNTHPSELVDLEPLLKSLFELREKHPDYPISLEIHESAVAHITTMKAVRAALNELNMKLAYDDFGAGQSRLSELIEAQPDFLKFDMRLIRGIDKATPQRQRLLGALAKMAKELGISPLAEGVENEGESETCRQLGFELFQGFFHGRPASASQYLRK